ncbi:hypothetical protein T12_4693 [Trichinella patagoniensis]|uniref:Uncharacterized protein n=1 Tax=Trichinella patagoniensis TaxID=990121 RepID=A0A0V0ZUE2_9BILA|nr:hypothetical protein T12_4693 [Trichinella patagoniensis]
MHRALSHQRRTQTSWNGLYELMAHDMPNAAVPSADTTIHNQCLHQAHYFKHRGIHVQQEQPGEPVTV